MHKIERSTPKSPQNWWFGVRIIPQYHAHFRLYTVHKERNPRLTAAQARDLCVELCFQGLRDAANMVDVPKVFRDLGYIDPTQAKLRVPFKFSPPEPAEPVVAPRAVAKPKPKASAAPRQLSISNFFARN